MEPLPEEKGGKTKKYWIVSMVIVVLLILFVVGYFIDPFEWRVSEITACGDGTLFGECSTNKPYFCENGTLVEKASICDCPDILTQEEDLCVSEYQTDMKTVELKYVLRGEEKQIYLGVYEGMTEYLYDLPVFQRYTGNQTPERGDFKLRDVEEEQQRELLLPLVIQIQNAAPDDKVEQARIAVSLVQNIPYGYSGKTTIFVGNIKTNYSRYPYDVIYDNEGICGEKSELLAFLLKELGYGTALFYYEDQNHEALGIGCPEKYSIGDSPYCFVETTGPAIITDDEITYTGGITLDSEPEVIPLSGGSSLPENIYEYKDAERFIELRKEISEKTWVMPWKKSRFEKLVKKYGIIGEYNIR